MSWKIVSKKELDEGDESPNETEIKIQWDAKTPFFKDAEASHVHLKLRHVDTDKSDITFAPEITVDVKKEKDGTYTGTFKVYILGDEKVEKDEAFEVEFVDAIWVGPDGDIKKQKIGETERIKIKDDDVADDREAAIFYGGEVGTDSAGSYLDDADDPSDVGIGPEGSGTFVDNDGPDLGETFIFYDGDFGDGPDDTLDTSTLTRHPVNIDQLGGSDTYGGGGNEPGPFEQGAIQNQELDASATLVEDYLMLKDTFAVGPDLFSDLG